MRFLVDSTARPRTDYHLKAASSVSSARTARASTSSFEVREYASFPPLNSHLLGVDVPVATGLVINVLLIFKHCEVNSSTSNVADLRSLRERPQD